MSIFSKSSRRHQNTTPNGSDSNLASPLITTIMGAPPSTPSTQRLSPQHERLILELLPFKDVTKFQEWLASPLVQGSWREFCHDYLSRTNQPIEADKAKTAQAAKDAINSRSQKFVVYHPDKTGWTADDHHVRFVVTVVLDNMVSRLWGESEWKKKPLDIAKAVYEVLCFMKPLMQSEPSPPSYSQ